MAILYLKNGIDTFYTFFNWNKIAFISYPTINFDFLSIYQTDVITSQFGTFIDIIATILISVVIANAFYKMNIVNRFKNKYQKENYSTLLTRRQRERGLVRVCYDRKGIVTRKRIECWWDRLWFPFATMQNNICSHFHLKPNRYWNVKKDFKSYCNDDEYQIINHAAGIPIISYRSWYLAGRYNKIFYLPSKAHTLFVGPTGTGKSWTFVLSMMISSIHANESMIVHDTKKELAGHTIELLKKHNYKIIMLDFSNPEYGDCWNPLNQAWLEWKKAIKLQQSIFDEEAKANHRKPQQATYINSNVSKALELISDFSLALCYEADAKQPMWWQGASDMIAAAALYLFEEGKDEYINFASIARFYDDDKSVVKLLNQRPIQAQSRMKAQVYLASQDITRGSYLTTFQNKIRSLLLSNDVIKMTSSNQSIDLRELFHQPTVVFLFSQSQKSTYYPLITSFINQFYEVAITEADKMENHTLKIPFKIYLDELAVLPPFKEIISMYTVSRSYNITFIAFVQSVNQLMEKYGKNITDTIIDNNANKIFLGKSAEDTNDYFKDQAGKEIYYNKTNQKFDTRDLITTDRLQKFEHGRALLICAGWDPYIIKLPGFNEYTFATNLESDISQKYKRDEISVFDAKQAAHPNSKNQYTNLSISKTNHSTKSNKLNM